MSVADGIGGHARGEVASQLTLQTLASLYQRMPSRCWPILCDFGRKTVLAAHRELHRYRAEHSLPEAPRTTLVACIVQRRVAIWAHVGDSRLYMIRGGRILDRTIDHSRGASPGSIGYRFAPKTRRSSRTQPHLQLYRAYSHHRLSTASRPSLCATATRYCCAPMACGHLERSPGCGRFRRKYGDARRTGSDGARAGAWRPRVDNCTGVAMTWAGTQPFRWKSCRRAIAVSILLIPEGTVVSTIQCRGSPATGVDERAVGRQSTTRWPNPEAGLAQRQKLVSK